MPGPEAPTCSLPSCRNRTRKPSGRCHFHESMRTGSLASLPLPAPAPSATSPGDEDRDYDTVVNVPSGQTIRIGDHSFRAGSVIHLRDGLIHRLDGPAVTAYRPEGVETEWWEEGDRHRGDGPAVVRAEGTEEWWYRHNEVFVDGPSPEGIPAHLRSGAHYAFDVEEQAKLVEAGADIEEAIEVALENELYSAEAVLAILDGAPAEWGRAFEEGRSA